MRCQFLGTVLRGEVGRFSGESLRALIDPKSPLRPPEAEAVGVRPTGWDESAHTCMVARLCASQGVHASVCTRARVQVSVCALTCVCVCVGVWAPEW